MRVAILSISLLWLTACETTPEPPRAFSNLDELIGTWAVTGNEQDPHFEFQAEDDYEIVKINNQYFLRAGDKLVAREAWKKHKNQNIELKVIERDGAPDYLCADGLELADHLVSELTPRVERQHVIAFVPKNNRPGETLITGDHKDDASCESFDTHGGRAHSQT